MTHLAQWGNSVAVRLPQDILKDLNMLKGTEVKIYEDHGRIIIEKQKEYTLKDLLKTECPYGEIETGHAVGSEEW
jgi:antitoxin MazE